MRLKIISCLIALAMIIATVAACTTIPMDNPNSSEDAPDSSLEASVDESSESVASESEDSSEEESEESVFEPSEDSSVEESASEDESSEEESSEDVSEESSRPVFTGDPEPVTPVPGYISTDSVDSYFNDSVFVGNSIMYGYDRRVQSWRNSYPDILGTAKFFCAGSFGFYNNSNPIDDESTHPSYQGVKYKIEDMPAVMGVKTVYLNLMGLNDLGMYSPESECARLTADCVIETIEKLQANSPDVEVVVLSGTYMFNHSKGKFSKLRNVNLSKLNQYILDYCNEKGLDYVDIANPLLATDDYLADEYCSDDYCHINEKGYIIWTELLRDYARAKQDGTWKNPKEMRIIYTEK